MPAGGLTLSHIVSVKTVVRDATAVAAACRRLRLPEPVLGTAKLFSGEATGLLVQLPGWQYPAVVDLASGEVKYDNFAGQWGSDQELQRFLQSYAVEKTKIEAQRRNAHVTETLLQDGSIRLQITAAGAP